MKRSLLFSLSLLTASILFGQAQIENPGFEGAWETGGDINGASSEPEQWSSLKSADALAWATPVVAFQETNDPHSGTYCIRLKATDSGFGPIAAGLLTNGRVHADWNAENGNVFTNEGNANYNLAFTDRPDSVVFWVKHSPVGGDQSKFEIILHDDTDDGELPHDGNTANWVGKARITMDATYTTWTRIAVPFVYFNNSTPDYLLCAISAGDSTIAIEDTEMWIDDIELIYNPNVAAINPPSPQNVNMGVNGTTLTLTATPNAAVTTTVTQEWKYSTTSGSGYMSFGTPETGTTYTPNFATPGLYYVVCEVDFGSEVIVTNEVEINVVDPGANSVTITPSASQTILTSENGNLMTANESPAPASSREWMYSTTSGSGYMSFGTPETGTTYTPNFATVGTYYIICESDFAGDVITSNEVTIHVPSSAGINEGDLVFNIFVANGVINVQFDGATENGTIFQLFTLEGKMVYQDSINGENSEHDIPSTGGIYVYRLVAGDQIITGKIKL